MLARSCVVKVCSVSLCDVVIKDETIPKRRSLLSVFYDV